MKPIKFFPLVLEAVNDTQYIQLGLNLKENPKNYYRYAGYKGGTVRVEAIENSNKWRIVERRSGMYPYVLEKLGFFKTKDDAQLVLDRWAKKSGRNPLPIK